MEMTRIYLIRHGDAFDAEGNQFDEYTLNNQGKVQALQLARRLKFNKFAAMYCSKLPRSVETCQIVNEAHHMEVVYTSALNEVGSDSWPKPGIVAESDGVKDLKEHAERIYATFQRFVKRHRGQEIIVFTHGNWIRALLAKILANSEYKTFMHFIIHNTSLTIIDIDSNGFEHIISVSDAAHTHLYDTHI